MPPTTKRGKYTITQSIPVSNHVYKFLKTRCRVHMENNEFRATRWTTIGSLVLSLMGENKDVKVSDRNYSKIFKVTIAEDSYNRAGMYICEANAQLFNDQVDRMFREELFYHVMINKGLDAEKYMNSIRDFLRVYNITEEDIKLDTVYRDFKRRKDEYDEQLNFIPAHGQNSQK